MCIAEYKLPRHKRVLINWLRRFKNPGDMIDLVKRNDISPHQVQAWQESFGGWIERHDGDARLK